MIRSTVVLVFLLTLTLAVGVVAAAQATQEGDFDLAIEQVEPTLPDLNAGDEVRFKVTYKNNGPDAVHEDLTVYISLTLMTTDDPPKIIGLPCPPEEAPGAKGLGPGGSNAHVFAGCNLILPLEDDYTAKAELLISKDDASVPPAERQYEESVDRNEANNVGFSEPFRAGPPDSALPDELGRLFAGLGMFAAVMAIMAVGTEVVIDTVKVSLGMKSKVTALDALERMEKLMPGQLAALGVGAADQEAFKAIAKNLRSTLQSSLKPLKDMTKVKQDMETGEFAEAFAKIRDLVGASAAVPRNSVQVTELKMQAQALAKDAIDRLAGALNFKPELQKELTDKVIAVIEKATAPNTDVEALLGEIAEQVVNLDWSAILTEDWLPGCLDQGETAILNLFKDEVKPQLEGLGLNPDLLTAAQGQLELGLSSIKTQVQQTADTYIESLRHLLDGVEARRFATQSPLRKVWRRLRAAAYGDEIIAVALGLVVTGVLWLVGAPLNVPFLADFQGWARAPVVGLTLGGASWAILFALARVGERKYRKVLEPIVANAGSGDGKNQVNYPDPSKFTTLHYVEYLWNCARGRDCEEMIALAQVEQPPQAESLAGVELTATTAARVVLARTDQQRDEEASRLRWLRAISAAVGFYLAYLMQIDAAELLDAAVPGIANTINGVLYLSGEQLNAFWPALSNERAITAGIILTGLAASAGSTFWHDQLDRLQQAKKGAESAAQMLEQARQISSGQRQGR